MFRGLGVEGIVISFVQVLITRVRDINIFITGLDAEV